MGNGVLGLGLVVIHRGEPKIDRKTCCEWPSREGGKIKEQAAASMDIHLACVIYIGSRGKADIDTLRCYSS